MGTPVSLDFSQAQPIEQAQQQSQPPQSSQSSQSQQPVTLDFSQAQPLQTTQPAQSVHSTQGQSAQPQATISATPGSMPGDPTAAKVALWAQNVASDMRHGTSITPVGKFLSALGAHGFDVGNSPEVGEVMGSLPLGLLRAIQGRAEMVQPGKRWQGTKDTIGGLADAATIPASFAAPEASELAGDGLTKAGSEIAEQAANAVKAIKSPFSADSIQPALKQGIRDAVNSAANDLGVKASDSPSILDVADDIAKAAKTKARVLYTNLDKAVGNTRFQAYQEQLDEALKELRNSISEENPDGHGELIDRVNALESAKQKAYDAVREQGLDPDALYAKAQGLWKRASALEDLGNHVQRSTSGMRPELAADAAKTTPETVSTSKLFNRANQMYTNGRLQVALGEDKAKALLQSIDAAHLQSLKIAARQKYAKLAGRLALYGGGYEALKHGAAHLLSE